MKLLIITLMIFIYSQNAYTQHWKVEVSKALLQHDMCLESAKPHSTYLTSCYYELWKTLSPGAMFFEESSPPEHTLLVARIFAEYKRNIFTTEKPHFPATFEVDFFFESKIPGKESQTLALKGGEYLMLGEIFEEGHIAGIDHNAIWLENTKGELKQIPLPLNLSDTNEDFPILFFSNRSPNSKALFAIAANIGLQLQGDFSDKPLDGIWQEHSVTDLLWGIGDQQGYRVIKDGQVLYFSTASDSDKAIRNAEISQAHMEVFKKRLARELGLEDEDNINFYDNNVWLPKEITDNVRLGENWKVSLEELLNSYGYFFVMYQGELWIAKSSVKDYLIDTMMRKELNRFELLIKKQSISGFERNIKEIRSILSSNFNLLVFFLDSLDSSALILKANTNIHPSILQWWLEIDFTEPEKTAFDYLDRCAENIVDRTFSQMLDNGTINVSPEKIESSLYLPSVELLKVKAANFLGKNANDFIIHDGVQPSKKFINDIDRIQHGFEHLRELLRLNGLGYFFSEEGFNICNLSSKVEAIEKLITYKESVLLGNYLYMSDNIDVQKYRQQIISIFSNIGELLLMLNQDLVVSSSFSHEEIFESIDPSILIWWRDTSFSEEDQRVLDIFDVFFEKEKGQKLSKTLKGRNRNPKTR